MNLKEQLQIQQMYNAQSATGKNDIEKRDDVIDDLKRQLKRANKQDVIIKDAK